MKGIIVNIQNRFYTISGKIKNRLSIIKKAEEKNKQIFQKLTPINNADLSIYKNALDFVFDNNDIKNIAISGPYSSGKSSVIETYKNLRHDKKFLHISLAHFTEMEVNKSIDESKINEPILEGKILNQLLHQINASKIPQTDFKIKRTIPKRKIMIFTFLFVCSILFVQYLLKFTSWTEFVNSISPGYIENILNKTITPYSQLIAGLFIIISIIFFIYSATNAQINKTIIKKLSFQGNNLELFDEKTESYFDKYLNEVLYIFDNAKADVIIFEDMDRYNANQIFVKLREINTLVNNKLENKKRTIRFLYLLKDDIFVNKDRAKFFDFILPIIPVIDGSNSYDQFIKHFKEGGIIDRFDSYFLQELSLYIDDMRILKNIYNEYLVYHSKIGLIGLDNNKLLAMIVYKNIFPRDFGELHLSRGYVYSLFSQKPLFVKKEMEKINIEILGIDEKIEIFKNECLKDLDELDTLYINILNNKQLQKNGAYIEITGSSFDMLKTIKEIQGPIKINTSSSTFLFDLKNAIASLEKNNDYLSRKKQINEKIATNLDDLKQRKKELQKLLVSISDKSLKDIINNNNIEMIFSKGDDTEKDNKETSFNEIKSNDYFQLIKYLVSYGYIDETYHDYMTYFYPNSITLNDKKFLRSITDKNAKDYNYKIEDPEMVISRLKPSYYEQEEILNFDLMLHLLNNRNKYEQHIRSIFNQLSLKKNILFCIDFMEAKRIISPMLKCIVEFWSNFLELALNSNSTYKEQRNKLVINVMSELGEHDLLVFNRSSILTNYLSEFPEFLSLINNIESLINKMKILSVKFTKFEADEINLDFFMAVYKNELYRLNFETISFILDTIYNINDKESILHKNYTSILAKPDEPLCQYIHKNIDMYIDIIINNCQQSINDDENSVIKIINNSDIEDDNKEKYIKNLKTTVSKIADVKNKDFWDILIENNNIKYNGTNIYEYYFAEGKGLNNTLINFINTYTGLLEISIDEINTTYGDDSASDFFNAIICCNELSNEVYERILVSSQWGYDEWEVFENDQISADKISILINCGTIVMIEPNLIFMRENYPDNVISFILMNIRKYIELINNDNIVYDELLSLLEESISDDEKIELIKKTQEKITIKHKSYSENIKIHILENNFDTTDIPYLIGVFDKETENMKEAIIISFARNVELLLTDQLIVPYNILIFLFQCMEIDYARKLNLLTYYIKTFNADQIKECLYLLNAQGFLQVFRNKRPKILINTTNEEILNAMKANKLIEKFSIDKNYKSYYRVYGKRKK